MRFYHKIVTGLLALVGPASFAAGEYIPIPAQNTVVATSVNEVQSILQAFEDNFASARSTYSLSAGEEPVIQLAAGTYGNLNLSGFVLSERVTVRGTSSYGFDGWVPTAGTKVARLLLNDSRFIRVMGFQAEVSSGVGHEMKNSTNCEIVRNTLAADPARNSTTAGNSKGNVNENLRLDGSTDCLISMNALIGGVARIVGCVNGNTDNIRFEWNVFDQGAGDCVNINSGTNNNWEFHNNLGQGRGRLPQGTHQDLVQVFSSGTAVAQGWNCTGNAFLTLPSFGSDSHAAQQMFWWGGGSQQAPTNVFTDNFAANTNGMVKNASGNNAGTAKFNTQWMCTDIPQAHASTYSCNWGGLESAQTTDENIVPQKATSIDKGAGTNGVHIYMPDSSYVENPSNDWSEQDNWTVSTITRANMGFAICKPKTGTRAHWTHADPTGSFQFFKRMYDSTDHDHWKDKGWPIAALCHEVYDPTNALGGTSGDYDSFDANGNYSTGGTISVTGVSLSPSSVSLYTGQTSQLSQAVSPANATNMSVTWSTSNSSVATVNSSGLVSAVATGSATITVTTVDGSYTDTCSVSVSTPPSGVILIDEDFTSDASNFDTETGGTWTVSSGRLALSSPASGGTALLGNIKVCSTSVSGNEYTVSGTVQAVATGGDWDDAALVFGYQDSDNYYYAILNESDDESNTNGLFKVVSGTPALLADFSPTYPAGTDYDVEVIRSGSSIVVKVDSTQIASVTDSTFTGGKVGFGTKNDSAEFDDLLVLNTDTTAPSTPTGLTDSNVTSTTVDLDWNASTDNVGVAGYKIYTGGSNPVDVGDVTGVTLTNLSPSTGYSFTVSAYDDADNESSQSSAASVTTDSVGSTVISEDFSVSAANFSVIAGGTWGVSSGRYVLSSPDTTSAGSGELGNISVHNTVLSGDYNVSAKVRITGTGAVWDDAALIFGYQDSDNFYYVSLNENSTANDYTKGVFSIVDGVPQELADITTSISTDTDYTVEVERTGSSIVVSLNSTQVASTTDSTFTGGQVGFGSKNDAAEFDDLSVDGAVASDTYVVLQSEDATLSGVSVNTGQTGYTGTGFVDYPYDGSGYVEYDVNASSAGDYLISVRYANGDTSSRYLDRTVNGSGSTSVEWPVTGGWSTWDLLDDIVTLSSGSNAIRFAGQGSEPGGANPDKMTVYYPDVYQAEDATLSGGATAKTTQTGYTGTGFVDYPANGGYIEFDVDVAIAGDYLISVRYANGDTGSRYLTRTVNGSGSASVEWPVTGGWSTWGLLNDTVTLSAGSNTIRFTGPTSPGGPNPDKMTVFGPLE